MKHLLAACLLPLLCLLTQPANSQAIAPLAPTVVRLAPGDVAQRPLVAMDTATYGTTRRYVATAGQLLLVRADRITQLERAGLMADSVQATYATELRQCRSDAQAARGDADRMRQAARVALASPPRPPWLLDAHTYKGAGLGAAALLLLKLFVFH